MGMLPEISDFVKNFNRIRFRLEFDLSHGALRPNDRSKEASNENSPQPEIC
jgi:hypothetical protein